jgi:hypothetical protein
MWVVRALVRLLWQIVIALAIAIVIAGIKALVSGGDTFHTFRVILMAMGAVLLLLGGTGTGSAASHRVNWMLITPGRGNAIARWTRPKPDEPRLSPGATFIAAGLVALVLGAVL